MSIDYATRLSNLVGIFESHNTTTATPDLSDGLTTRVKNIYNDFPAIRGMRGDLGPAIFVSINNATENESQIGNFTNRKKFKVIAYDIHGVYRREGISKQHFVVIQDFYKMAENIEAVIKRETNAFDSLIVNMDVVDTDFKGEQPDNSIFKVFRIGVNIQYIFS